MATRTAFGAVSPVAAHSGDRLLSEPTAGTQPCRREQLFMGPFGSRDHWSGRYEPYPPDQGIYLDQVRDLVLLVTQRVSVEATGLVNEFSIERLPLGLDCFVVREAKLRPLCQPRAPKRCEPADCGSSQGRQR